MIRASNTPPGPDPFLDIRIGLFVLGAILGLTGMFMRVPVIISFGILCLAIGMILGFIGKRRRRRAEEEAEDFEDPPAAP
ncbi:MAG TPA: hypothetical protein VK928_01340 [Longimicrobiales bacterium]|nr:hypothetical protein [Longimicrobiales bacterium]